MYNFMCFILLLSLEGLKGDNTVTTMTLTSPENSTNSKSHNVHTSTSSGKQDMLSISSEVDNTELSSSSEVNNTEYTNKLNEQNTASDDKKKSDPSNKKDDCLFNLKNEKELLLWIIISLLCLICLLLLIIMCMACKSCRSRNNKMVVLESSKPARRNSVNGGPSETDILLKDCSSVKVEMETTPAESEKPEEVGGADAEEVENQNSTEENKNTANDTSETAPTQEADQPTEMDLKTEAKTEALENTE